MSEQAVILYRRFLEGDEASLEKLIGLYRHALLRFIYGYVQDIFLAEEILVDVFIALYFKRPFQERENATFKTYLYTIARNKALNALKKRKRNKELSLETLTETGGEAFLSAFSAFSPSPELITLTAERNKRLYQALQSLPESYREVLILRYFDGFSPEKIAEITLRAPKQVYNLLSRGKTALRKRIEETEKKYENE